MYFLVVSNFQVFVLDFLNRQLLFASNGNNAFYFLILLSFYPFSFLSVLLRLVRMRLGLPCIPTLSDCGSALVLPVCCTATALS